VRRDLTIVDGPDMREVIKAHFLPGFIRYVWSYYHDNMIVLSC
jgi:hypothetical protein